MMNEKPLIFAGLAVFLLAFSYPFWQSTEDEDIPQIYIGADRLTFNSKKNDVLVSAYRDIKRVLDKKKYGGRDLAKPSKTSLKELELINPDLAKEIREINKQFRDIEKAFED